jgi:hypothetical protein
MRVILDLDTLPGSAQEKAELGRLLAKVVDTESERDRLRAYAVEQARAIAEAAEPLPSGAVDVIFGNPKS